MLKYIYWLALAAAVLGSTGCKDRGPVDLQALEAAKTSEAEAAAFEALRKDATTLGFIAHDAEGNKLPGPDAPWEGQLVSVTIRVDGAVIKHEMIDPKNVSLLMGE